MSRPTQPPDSVSGYESARGDLVVALTGECMISRPLTSFRESRFLRLRELLLAADVRFTNGETQFHDYEHPPDHLHVTYMRCDPRLVEDVKWLGINLMSCANNHSHDYGEGGLLTNLRHLDQAGLVHAGTGRNYAAAVAPAYLDTANGRVALVSATTTSQAHARAGEQRRDMQGRPGANVIRWTTEWTVDAQAFVELQRVAERLGWPQRPPPWWTRAYGLPAEAEPDTVYFGDKNTLGQPPHVVEDAVSRFVRADQFGLRGRLHQADLARNLASVGEARRMADWVIFSIHNHEAGASVDDPSDHVRLLAHEVIDAGADVVVGHGPHRDRGIELYNGKPIFYSLGNFLAQQPSMTLQPHEMMLLYGLGHEHSVADLYDAHYDAKRAQPGPYWWSVIPVLEYTAGRLQHIALYPIELGFGLPRWQAGRPLLAEGESAQQALAWIRARSAALGTPIDVDGDIGRVRLA
jgi:poly-gamma-glutamate capsule biosynthesis protein CapA/YwtB (metallophosphatase superfamily)